MRRSGFTLIEVIIALSLAAMVVLLAHRVFASVVEGSQRVREARTRLDREANAGRWLTAAFGSLTVGTVGGSFDGEPARVSFSAWLPVASGGFAPSRVALGLEEGRLVARLDQGDSVVLADSVASATFDYLLEPGANERWVGEWISPVSAPVAVRLRFKRELPVGNVEAADTLLLLVGPRG